MPTSASQVNWLLKIFPILERCELAPKNISHFGATKNFPIICSGFLEVEPSWQLPWRSLHIIPHPTRTIEVLTKICTIQPFTFPCRPSKWVTFAPKLPKALVGGFLGYYTARYSCFSPASRKKKHFSSPQPLLCAQWRLCGQVLQVSSSRGGGEEVETEADVSRLQGWDGPY